MRMFKLHQPTTVSLPAGTLFFVRGGRAIVSLPADAVEGLIVAPAHQMYALPGQETRNEEASHA